MNIIKIVKPNRPYFVCRPSCFRDELLTQLDMADTLGGNTLRFITILPKAKLVPFLKEFFTYSHKGS